MAIAKLLLQDLAEFCLEKLKFKIPLFVRYVDEIWTCVPLNFTYEIEKENAIDFLELKMNNEKEKLIFGWKISSIFSRLFPEEKFQIHP